MREVMFRVLAERPGHLEAQAVGAALSAGVTLPNGRHPPEQARSALTIRPLLQHS
jgi:hypothetical protein